MPLVNVKYTLELDATVNIHHLKFANKSINKENDKKGSNYEGIVEEVGADDTLAVDLLLTGSAGVWILKVWVCELDEHGNETSWKPLKANGSNQFKDNIKTKNNLDGEFEINW